MLFLITSPNNLKLITLGPVSDHLATMTIWSRFASEGASTSRGSGVTRVYKVDQAINLFPFPLDFGRSPKAIFIHLTDLTQFRLAEIRVFLEDAH